MDVERTKARLGAARRRAKEPLFNSRLGGRLDRRRRILGVGDSHIKVFKEMQRTGLVAGAWLEVCFVDGGTALGLTSTRSQTNALQVFRDRLRRARRWQSLVFQLGEVDCGSAIWRRAARHEATVEEQLERSVTNYLGFLDDVAGAGFDRRSVLSVPLPTIADYAAQPGSVAAQRSGITASQADRTALTLEYNARLQAGCAARGHRFVDVTPDLLDARTGLIRDAFVHPDPGDHHLAPDAYGRLLAPLI